MTRRMLLTIVAVALVALGVGQVASAQNRYEFKVPFSFVAAGPFSCRRRDRHP
jgi:hypothetical protein